MSEEVALRAGSTEVSVSPFGAELRSLRAGDADWLWNGNPDYWSGTAPVLFPVIGKSPGDAIAIGGKMFPMPSHGFARHSRFEIIEKAESSARFQLRSSPLTEVHFPFAFVLDVSYELAEGRVTVIAHVKNCGERAMPFQLGLHPAFVFPLPAAGGMKHHLRAQPGRPMSFSRVDKRGRLGPERVVSKTDGEIELSHNILNGGALVAADGVGSRVTYEAGGSSVHLDFAGFSSFAVWSKPEGRFICLEPWRGRLCDQDASTRTIDDGALVLDPSGTAHFTMSVSIARTRS